MAKKQVQKQRTTTLEPMTLTIRAHEQDQIRAILALQKLTGEKTASGAVFKAAEMLPDLNTQLHLKKNQIEAMGKQVRTQNEILHFMYSAQKQVEEFGKKNFKGQKFPGSEIDFPRDDDDDEDYG